MLDAVTLEKKKSFLASPSMLLDGAIQALAIGSASRFREKSTLSVLVFMDRSTVGRVLSIEC